MPRPDRHRRPTRRTALAMAAWSCVAHANPGLAAGNDSADAEAFRDEVIEILRSEYPDAVVTRPGHPDFIRSGPFVLNLGHLRQGVANLSDAERRTTILKIIGPHVAAKPPPSGTIEPFVRAATRLRIQLVPHEYREQAPELICRRFSEKLWVAYALDESNRYQLVTQPIFDAWGIDQAKLEKVAADNLEKESDGVEIRISPTGAKGHFASVADESGYAAARILLPAIMDQIRTGLRTTGMVVAVPTRNILIAWDPESEGRDRLARIVTDYVRKGPYRRSSELFHSSADGLRPLGLAELAQHGR
ncbi:DUF1444 family protein [Methylobacterium sp. BTF04]|uniref:DUF1444 family protein n=1 Tax=Methylobacterium sp. BTF04 TaxID=2708300 RepID=UPI0013D56F51|nr:DUF1444 family protein [Methylobacterium sp. BTF04]NEU11127.1 DUF1444 family protein [Methylobacterium sp. BTF04]